MSCKNETTEKDYDHTQLSSTLTKITWQLHPVNTLITLTLAFKNAQYSARFVLNASEGRQVFSSPEQKAHR